jgi:hypothetical protein
MRFADQFVINLPKSYLGEVVGPVMRICCSDFSVIRVMLLAAISLIYLPARAQLTFDFTTSGVVPQTVIDGFEEAGQLWSASITNAVTINIQIGYESLGASILGTVSSSQFFVSYSTYRAALDSHRTSTYDTSALASLPNASSYAVSYNRLTDTGNSAPASATPAVGVSDRVIVNQSLLRALNIPGTFTDPDASITFSSDFNFDFDRGDGITSGSFDFVGVAAHEIGHALGFNSIGDAIDNKALTANPLDVTDIEPTTLDLFRFSAEGTRDISIGLSAYLSLDGGVTSLGSLSTGVNTGDGRQASHWKDNLGLGLMDPTLAAGELGSISTADLQALDIMGWSVGQFSAVPEPSAYGLFAGIFIFGVAWRRRGVR